MTAKKTATVSSLTYDALSLKQRGNSGPQLVLFHAPVGEILSFASVAELTPTTKGPQREQNEVRVQAIAKFLNNKANIIPTAVILAFGKGAASFKAVSSKKVGALTISREEGPTATIVDGQHRLFGMKEADPNMEVAVVALLDADKVERAFHFLVINNKASKIAATHTKALLASMKGTPLANRLKDAKLAFDVDGIKDVDLVNSDPDSPFYKAIDWSTTPEKNRLIQATAIEASLDYLGSLGVPEYDDRDVRRSVFLMIWKTIKSQWKPYWTKESTLVSKVGIVCLTRFIADRITNWADSDELEIEVTDLEQIEGQTKRILKRMDPSFWVTPWALKAQGGFDTNQGRERVVQAITQLYRNGKHDIPWYTDIDIVDRSNTSKLKKSSAAKKK